MQAKELRIGNLVQIKQELRVGLVPDVVTVDCIEDTPRIGIKETPPMWGYFAEEEIEPIPLTEEWLLKFGFKQWGDKYTFGLKGINIHHRQRGFVLRKSVPVIQYVHQLQNLYFALTGEELTLK